MKIGGLQKLTLIDYPGKIACTIFTVGCNFRCPFCYNPELVLPAKIKNHPLIAEKEIFAFLKERQGLLEGVCITGGEPTINADLPQLISKIKRLGYFVKLDTNGSNPQMLEALIDKKMIDYVAMDIKAPIITGKRPGKSGKKINSRIETLAYSKAVGKKVDLMKIKRSINVIRDSGIDYEFRTTVVPGLHRKEDILLLARMLAPAKRFYLQAFKADKNLDPKINKTEMYSQAYLLEIKQAIEFLFDVCGVR
ncbi:MAG: anaerobic ribonucleoside-triphosphate reductase activating protein [bacterium]